MPQAQVKNFPGFGIVYPGGGERGIKVVKTFTQAPKKVFNADGSVSYEPPPPTVHELFGGGFCYAGGNPVTDREHLENISDPVMKKRALEWYDKHGKAISPEDVVVREEGQGKVRPEPAYILSNQIPQEQDEVTKSLSQQGDQGFDKRDSNSNLGLAKAISELATLVKKQGEEIAQMKAVPPIPSKIRKRGLQSQSMKDRWADPAFREKMKHRGKRGKEEGEVKEEV